MQIKINGKTEEIQAATVLDVLKVKNIEPRMVAVELNEIVVKKAAYANTLVGDGDAVEVVNFVGGG